MPAQQQRQTSSHNNPQPEVDEPTVEVDESNSGLQEQVDGGGGGGGDGADGGGEGGETEAPEIHTLGGGTHVVQGGETLRKIASDTYFFEHYWTNIRDANPTKVFRAGALLMVNDVLTLPEIDVPIFEGPDTEVPAGGDAAATYAEQQNTEFGVFLVYPNDYSGPLDSSDGATRLRREVFDALMLGREQLANAMRVTVESLVIANTSYSLFDWAITDEEATQAIDALASLPVEQIEAAKANLGDVHWSRLVENLPEAQKSSCSYAMIVAGLEAHMDGTPPTSEELKLYFDITADNELPALARLMSMRFGFEVGGRDGSDWTAEGMRRAWGVLEQLPPQHVQDNEMLDLFLRDQGESGAGYYDPSDNSGVIGYGSDLEETGGYGEIMVTDDEGNEVDVGLHSSVNLFNTVVRHEIGHAVDEKMGVSSSYATSAANAGKWKLYGSESEFVDDVIAKAGGMDGHGYADAAIYERALRKAVTDHTNFLEALWAIKNEDDVDDDLAEPGPDCGGPVQVLFYTDRWASSDSPWYTNPDRDGAGGRMFVEAYEGWFYSFDEPVRAQRGISAYQWRAPGEWFAEVYACYYSDHDSVNGAAPGTRLRTRDSTTADWMDRNVHNRASLPQETNQAEATPTEGATGGDSGMGADGGSS